MAGEVQLRWDEDASFEAGRVATLVINKPARHNAMTRAMWRQLRSHALALAASPTLRCVVVRGAGGHFCAGGDISEYPDFRFDAASLRDFHENDVWGGLSALLALDVPLIAQIDGHCMGAGVEIASCADVRLAADNAKFGAPIAKLGFPMAPKEAELVTRAVGELTAREMLLTAAVLPAAEMKTRGFLNAVLPADAFPAEVHAVVRRVLPLSPQAARLHKQAFRGEPPQHAATKRAKTAIKMIANDAPASYADDPYAYADSAEHREGITAFIAKRAPNF